MSTDPKPSLEICQCTLAHEPDVHSVLSPRSSHLRTWAQNTGAQTVIHCAGDIVYYREADHLVDVVTECTESDVVLDLKYVNTVDVYGLGKLLDLCQLLAERAQRITFANPSQRLQALFSITMLDFCFLCDCGRRLT